MADKVFKILLIGDSGAGKSSILQRFSDDTFAATFINTIGVDFRIKTIDIRGDRIKLQIWDTAGQERFHSITRSYYRGAAGILLVYDITDAKSFDQVDKWLSRIQEHAKEGVEKMILGNKCDMEKDRVISKDRGEALARANNTRFLEVSAKSNVNIDRAFQELSVAILDKSLAVQGNGFHDTRPNVRQCTSMYVNVDQQEWAIGQTCCK